MFLRQFIRRFRTTPVRKSHDDHHHVSFPGSNLPFDTDNRYKLTVIFTAFLSSGFVVPYLIVRHQLLKD